MHERSEASITARPAGAGSIKFRSITPRANSASSGISCRCSIHKTNQRTRQERRSYVMYCLGVLAVQPVFGPLPTGPRYRTADARSARAFPGYVSCFARHDNGMIDFIRRLAAIASQEGHRDGGFFFAARSPRSTFSELPEVLNPTTTSPGLASPCTCRAKTSA